MIKKTKSKILKFDILTDWIRAFCRKTEKNSLIKNRTIKKQETIEGEFVDEKFFTFSGFLFYTDHRAALREIFSLLNSKVAGKHLVQDVAAISINIMGMSPAFAGKMRNING